MEALALRPETLAALPPEVIELIRWQAERIAQLEACIAELEAKLKQNSTNSSKPPSSDPPSVKRAPPKPASGKKPGGQPGHPKAERALVEAPDHIYELKPSCCRRCARSLAGSDPEPLRHQVTELPPVKPVVTEYRRHRLRCPGCGTTTCGELPAGVTGQDGPALQSACALLTGAYRLSKTKAAKLLGELFDVPMSAAQVCANEAAVGEHLQPVVDDWLAAARQQPANVDETSMGKGRWLWVMATAVATVYRIVAGRNRDQLMQLLGPDYQAVLTSDRHSLYGHLPDRQHQYCWAHLRRDFQAMVDRQNQGSKIGKELLALSGQMLGWWQRVRDGTLARTWFMGRMHAEGQFRSALRAVLERGEACGCAKTAGTCRELLDREVSMFVFAFRAGVEPTNNAAERAVRHGVLWRKQSHGPKSAAGACYLANIWSVVETCRQHGRSVWKYLIACLHSARRSESLPNVLETIPQSQVA